MSNGNFHTNSVFCLMFAAIENSDQCSSNPVKQFVAYFLFWRSY